MKTTVIEVIKANKGKMFKKGLIFIGSAVGLILAYGLLKGENEKEYFDQESNDDGNDVAEVIDFNEN